MRYAEYPHLRGSNISWLGRIPTHWEIKRLKYLSDVMPSNVDKKTKPDEISVFLCNYTDVYYNDFITDGVSHVQAAVDAGVEVSDTQYVIAGAALLASAVEKAGGFGEVGVLTEGDEGYQEFQDAEEYFTAGGAADLLDMFDL